MPSKSEQQRKFIFAKRSQYRSKEKTPEKYKFIWEKSWEEIEETFDEIVPPIPMEKVHNKEESMKVYKRKFFI